MLFSILQGIRKSGKIEGKNIEQEMMKGTNPSKFNIGYSVPVYRSFSTGRFSI